MHLTCQQEKGEELSSISTHSQTCTNLVTEMSTAYFQSTYAVTRLIADEIYPPSGFVFNYIFIDVVYSNFEVIDLSVFQIDKAWV